MGFFSSDKDKDSKMPKQNDRYILAMEEFQKAKFSDDEKAREYLQLAFREAENNVFDMHFWYNHAIDYYCRQLSDPEAEAKCLQLCKENMAIAPDIIAAYKNEYHKESLLDFIPPSIPAFLTAAEIYEANGEYSKAAEVSEKAAELRLRDGTPGGFKARKERLEKKLYRT
ncbi:hypothetical protein ACFO4L_08350 [Bacillus daqingensis]|uniref:Tetratricopeptide repeat protein n=1 Tax=Bacillus daqingensis TaxID=872396 RepID=A0ABV9NT60_9BACI